MNKNKAIWIINQYAGSPEHGMEYRHYLLGQELQTHGYEIYIISGSYSHLYKSPPKLESKFTYQNIDNIHYYWLKVPEYKKSISLGRLWNMFMFNYRLKEFIDNTLINSPISVIVSSPSLFPINTVLKRKRSLNCKIFFEIRDLWPQTLIELGGLSKINPLIYYMERIERYGYKYSDAVVSLLPNAKGHMVNKGMHENKFKYIPNGIKTDNNEKGVALGKGIINKFPKDKFIVGYVGTIGSANNLKFLIEAAKNLNKNNNIHFVIIGKGSEKDDLMRIAFDLYNVTFLPPIEKKYVFTVLEKIDVCYIGLIREPLFRFGVSPNKLFEYMWAAKPIIYAIDSGNKPVDEANCGKSVSPENVNELVESIKELYKMPEKERKKLGKNGKEYVKKYHSYSVIANKYKELIQK